MFQESQKKPPLGPIDRDKAFDSVQQTFSLTVSRMPFPSNISNQHSKLKKLAQLALLDVLQKLLVVGTAERRVAHNHLEENGADGPYVRLGVVLLER